MLTVTKWIAAPIVVIALMYSADSPSAHAQYGCYPGGVSIGIGGGYYGGYRGVYTSRYRASYGYGYGAPLYGHYRAGYRGGYLGYPSAGIYRHSTHLHVGPGPWGYGVGGFPYRH